MKPLQIEEIHKEIDLVQDCIKRMSNNSFYIKGWFVTLSAVIIALENFKLDKPLILLISIITLVFWFLDASYVAYERCFRKLYRWNLNERSNNKRDHLYDLNIKTRFTPEAKDYWSKEVTVLYGAILIVCIVLFFTR